MKPLVSAQLSIHLHIMHNMEYVIGNYYDKKFNPSLDPRIHILSSQMEADIVLLINFSSYFSCSVMEGCA